MKLALSFAVAGALALATTAGAAAPTAAQYGAKCNTAWPGKRGTPGLSRVQEGVCGGGGRRGTGRTRGRRQR